MRRTLYIVVAIFVLAAVLIPMPMRQERSWVDSVSGSMKRETVSPFGRSSGEILEPSPLEQRLRASKIPWTPDWRFLHNVRRTAFGRAAVYECGSAPPIYQIRSVLEDFQRASSDDQLRDFVKVMQSGSEAEQKAAVDAAGEAGLQAMAARPGGWYSLSRMADTRAIPFHAKVRIRSATPATREIDGRLGYVAGITERPLDDDGRFGYGVFIYDLSRVWMCAEAELEPTGEVDEQAVRNSEMQRQRLAAKHAG